MARKIRQEGPPRLVDAQFRWDYRGFQHFEVRDLDMHGVFVVEPGGALTRLPKDAWVDVALKLHSDGRNRVHRLRARVESRKADGASLVFTDADLETYSALLDINAAEGG